MQQTIVETEKELKSATMMCYFNQKAGSNPERPTERLIADEDMHIVAIEHFIGVNGGGFSDNGHIFSKSPDNPWVKWEGTRMEPTGTKGYFGYCGRDYYSEVGGVNDITVYETFPSGHYFLVRAGETLYLHCYGNGFSGKETVFHHTIRLIYW